MAQYWRKYPERLGNLQHWGCMRSDQRPKAVCFDLQADSNLSQRRALMKSKGSKQHKLFSSTSLTYWIIQLGPGRGEENFAKEQQQYKKLDKKDWYNIRNHITEPASKGKLSIYVHPTEPQVPAVGIWPPSPDSLWVSFYLPITEEEH